MFIRKKRGRKTGKKKEKEAYDNFIEFILPNSVNKLQKLSLTKGFMISGKKAKFFKAGTKPDYFVVKKKVFNWYLNYLKILFDIYLIYLKIYIKVIEDGKLK